MKRIILVLMFVLFSFTYVSSSYAQIPGLKAGVLTDLAQNHKPEPPEKPVDWIGVLGAFGTAFKSAPPNPATAGETSRDDQGESVLVEVLKGHSKLNGEEVELLVDAIVSIRVAQHLARAKDGQRGEDGGIQESIFSDIEFCFDFCADALAPAACLRNCIWQKIVGTDPDIYKNLNE